MENLFNQRKEIKSIKELLLSSAICIFIACLVTLIMFKVTGYERREMKNLLWIGSLVILLISIAYFFTRNLECKIKEEIKNEREKQN